MLTDHQAAKFVLRSIETEHSEATDSALARTAKELGIGRVTLWKILSNRNGTLKDKKLRPDFDRAVIRRIAVPGTPSYQHRWAEVSKRLPS
jgi:hypothetical protein